MIDKEKVIKLVEEKLDEKMFLVDVSVSKTNAIDVFVDGFDGMTIEKCIEISRNVEHNLDREEEDFSLQVSSPGLTESFKVKQQYIKYQGREVEVVTGSGEQITGTLIEVSDDEITVNRISEVLELNLNKTRDIVKKWGASIDQYEKLG